MKTFICKVAYKPRFESFTIPVGDEITIDSENYNENTASFYTANHLGVEFGIDDGNLKAHFTLKD